MGTQYRGDGISLRQEKQDLWRKRKRNVKKFIDLLARSLRGLYTKVGMFVKKQVKSFSEVKDVVLGMGE